LENFHHLQGEHKNQGGNQDKKKNLRGGDAPQGSGTGKKRTREQASEWKDKDAELAGIPADILKEWKKGVWGRASDQIMEKALI